MSHNNESTLLVYGFHINEEETLKRILEENNLPGYKVIDEQKYDLVLEDIIDGKQNESINGELPNEKVVLFYQCNDEEITSAMRQMKASYASKPIFAVVTPTSIKWKFSYLLEHLMEEKSRFENMK